MLRTEHGVNNPGTIITWAYIDIFLSAGLQIVRVFGVAGSDLPHERKATKSQSGLVHSFQLQLPCVLPCCVCQLLLFATLVLTL